jgi:hypothetical protein
MWWARRELVRGRSEHVGVAAAPEHPELVVAWWHAEEEGVWCRRCRGAAWTPVDQVRGRGERLSPERQGSCTVNQQSSDTVISGAQDAFRLAILLRCVGIRESELDAERGQKKVHGIGIILTAIVCLKRENGKAKLSLNIGNEQAYCRKNVRLIA